MCRKILKVLNYPVSFVLGSAHCSSALCLSIISSILFLFLIQFFFYYFFSDHRQRNKESKGKYSSNIHKTKWFRITQSFCILNLYRNKKLKNSYKYFELSSHVLLKSQWVWTGTIRPLYYIDKWIAGQKRFMTYEE